MPAHTDCFLRSQDSGSPRGVNLIVIRTPVGLMVPVMAIGSEGFGGCGWEIEVSVEHNKADAYICSGWKYFEVSLGAKSTSRLAVVLGDGARYWRAFLMLWASFKNQKAPVGAWALKC